ncbi:MAG: nucleoside hydrolase [Clostridiales bacterium]|nr:nucleoside hydrolase [Clostridiales bacterium]
MRFDVRDEKKIRVIVDTDAACEADDPFAIAHALMSPKLIVKGITAEHFNAEGSVDRSYEEIRTILEAMDKDVPFFRGEEGQMGNVDLENISEASEFIINEALSDDPHPLFVLCQGAITNVAVAIKKRPNIISKMTVIWIGTHGAGDVKAPFREFNAGNDVEAANLVLRSGVKLWLVPSTVYSTITIGIAEVERKIYPCGEIGRHLFENMIEYNMSDGASWTQGESWSLGDSPAIALAINPGCGHYEDVPAPHINEDTSSSYAEHNPIIRVYKDVDSRYILEDFISKLQLEYGDEK